MNEVSNFDPAEQKKAWTSIWLLTDRDPVSGDYRYYKGLTIPERKEMVAFLQDILEDTRSLQIGERFTKPDTTEVVPVDRGSVGNAPNGIYDPAGYSFGERKKWVPFAVVGKSGAKRGQYAKQYPRGLVVHWTAGHRNGLALGNELMRDTGMLYLIGDKDGNLGQSDPLTHHGYHAGVSSHKFAEGYVSDEFAGLELQAAGNLTKKADGYYSWFGTRIPDGEWAVAARNENIAAGVYHIYTQAQMMLIRRLVAWLYLNDPDVFSPDRVVGHDEVSPGRKSDPGGAVIDAGGNPQPMSWLRTTIWNDIDRISQARKKI